MRSVAIVLAFVIASGLGGLARAQDADADIAPERPAATLDQLFVDLKAY